MSLHPFVRGRSSELRKGRISEDFACYSITKTILMRRKVLAHDAAARVLMSSWNFLRSRGRMKLLAFCIMPDHYHAVLCLMPGENLSKLMEDSGKFTAREINKLLGTPGQFWQEGFYDHRCRDDEETHDLSLYIEHNPVRAKLVSAAELWPYSSAFPANSLMLDRDWWP
jgi:putative transposase